MSLSRVLYADGGFVLHGHVWTVERPFSTMIGTKLVVYPVLEPGRQRVTLYADAAHTQPLGTAHKGVRVS